MSSDDQQQASTSNAARASTRDAQSDNTTIIELSTNDTLSDLSGAGRTLGMFYSFMGHHIERVVNGVAVHMGVGAEGAAHRIFCTMSNAPIAKPSQTTYWSEAATSIFDWDRREYWSQFKYRTFRSLSAWEKKQVLRECYNVLKEIHSPFYSNQYRALESLIALLMVFPDLQTAFTQQNAIQILETMRISIRSNGCYSRERRDLLTASAGRALCHTEETEANTTAKEFIAACSVPEDQRTEDWRVNGYRRWGNGLSDLGTLSKNESILRLVDQCERHPVKVQIGEPLATCERCRGMAILCREARSEQDLLSPAEGSRVEGWITYFTAEGVPMSTIIDTFNLVAPRLLPLSSVPEEEGEDRVMPSEALTARARMAQTLIREIYPNCNDCAARIAKWREWYARSIRTEAIEYPQSPLRNAQGVKKSPYARFRQWIARKGELSTSPRIPLWERTIRRIRSFSHSRGE